jgi:RNA polymerase sigma-70 factor (ECF subfamily)
MNEFHSGADVALEDMRWLRALAARLVRDPHMADDAVQETLLAAMERRPRTTGSLRAWLAAVLRNVLRQEWRGRGRRARLEAQASPPGLERPTVEIVEELALHRRLVECVQELDEPYRTVVVLRYLRGREVPDIARELGIPEKTVRSRLSRAVERLRRRLEPERGQWLALLIPSVSLSSQPALPAFLIAMKLKVVAAIVVLCLIGAFFFVRTSPVTRTSEPIAGGSMPMAEAPIQQPALEPGSSVRAREIQPDTKSPVHVATPALEMLDVHGFVRTLDGSGLTDLEVVFEGGSQGVFASGDGLPATKSGTAGEFILTCPKIPGRLDVRSEEFIGVALPQLDGTPPTTIPIVVAAPLRHYAGVVVDESGSRVGGAHVEITLDGSFVQSRNVGGQAVHLLLPFVEATCDASGVFRFERTGSVSDAVIVASADGYADARMPLPAASSQGIELVLKHVANGPRTILGLVVDENDAPVAGAQVSLGGRTVETDADGKFRIDCEAWRKSGWIRAFVPGRLPAEIALESPPQTSTLDHPLVLHLGGEPRSIRGRLVDADGMPVAGAFVWTPDTTPFGEVVMHEGEHSFTGGTTVEALLGKDAGPWATQVGAETDGEGRFALSGLLDRNYKVFALDDRSLEGVGPLEARGGDVNVLLRMSRTSRTIVAGRVVSRAGVPLAGVRVAPGRRMESRADRSPGEKRWDGFGIASPIASHVFKDAGVVTDAEGRFELPPLVTRGTFLSLSGKPLVLGDSFDLADAAHLEALEISVDASSRFRIILARANEADSFRLEESDGKQVPLFIEVEGVTISAAQAEIDRGRSGVVLVAEGDHVVVLQAGKDEVRRVRTHFAAGGVIDLNP